MRLLLILCTILCTQNIFGQDSRFSLEPEFQTSFSIVEPTRQSVFIPSTAVINMPDIMNFRFPVYGASMHINYDLSNHFALGLGMGVSVAKFENHPLFGGEYVDQVMVPYTLKLRYKRDIGEKWNFLVDLGGGYQYADQRFGWDGDKFTHSRKGGPILTADVGIGRQVGKYTPTLKVGYEYFQFQNKHYYGWIDSDIDPNANIVYTTKYHMINVALSVRI